MTINTPLNTNATTVNRIKYFNIPISCSNMLPNITYTVSINGISVGPWCKPLNGVLGGPLTSDASGKLSFTYMFSVPYRTTFISNPGNITGLLQQQKVFTLTDPRGNQSITYLPQVLKAN